MLTMEFVTYLLTGAVAGLMAGLLGIGGGLVIVPTLAILFVHQGFTADTIMHYAVGTSLATIVVTSVSSLLAHHRRGSVDWLIVRRMSPSIVVGALGGARLAGYISSPGLGMFFGVFELLVALQLAFAFQPAAHRPAPGKADLGLAGAVIGAVSALLGIGGGTLTVPFLLWNRIDIRSAVGTAAACGLPIAMGGAAGFAMASMSAGSLQGQSTGFIYWPAAGGIVLASVPAAPLGARLAHYLPRVTLQRVFALLLAIIGVKMMLVAGT